MSLPPSMCDNLAASPSAASAAARASTTGTTDSMLPPRFARFCSSKKRANDLDTHHNNHVGHDSGYHHRSRNAAPGLHSEMDQAPSSSQDGDSSLGECDMLMPEEQQQLLEPAPPGSSHALSLEDCRHVYSHLKFKGGFSYDKDLLSLLCPRSSWFVPYQISIDEPLRK